MDCKNSELFQKHLVERLSKHDLDENLLKNSSLLIAQSYEQGINWDDIDIFPVGILPPHAHTISARGKIDPKDLSSLNELLKSSIINKIEIFPRGIIAPEYLEVFATFSHNRHNRYNNGF